MDPHLFSSGLAHGAVPNYQHPGNALAQSDLQGMSNALRNPMVGMSGSAAMSTNMSSALASSLPAQYLPPASTPAPAHPGMGAAPVVSLPLASSSVPGMRCGGLEYANMKKEKAREEYKEKRRLELLANGEYDRTKRRKKNDTSMSENQKYHRRLKMNQDSAAAARHAQEVYVSTLEKLVETTEAEKSILSLEAVNLRAERDDLARRVRALQQDLSSLHAPNKGTENSVIAESGGMPQDAPADPGATHLMIRKVLEMMEAPDGIGAPAEFAKSVVGIQPAPAV